MEYETVLVLQGGGSLGAYECGVYKTLHKHKIKFDIVAGTSIGGINAAIISGAKNDEPAKSLKVFWLSRNCNSLHCQTKKMGIFILNVFCNCEA